MKISLFSYELKPLAGNPPRSGALLKWEKGEEIGYADLHPWPELGDWPLEMQLSELRAGRLTALTRNSLRFAELDAQARGRGVSLFEGLTIPESHFLITDLQTFDPATALRLRAEGYRQVKVKVGRDSLRLKETAKLREIVKEWGPEVRLRLDFNALLKLAEVESWLEGARDLLEKIDWIEDPVQWNPLEWQILRRNWGVRLAADREGDGVPEKELRQSADLRVVKPAVMGREWESLNHFPCIFTSYLDHPVGQLCAAYEAATARARGVRVEGCGLISHPVYEANPFSERMRTHGPFLLPVEGPGLGWGDLLASLKWRALK